MNQTKLAEARRLYHHVCNGGTLTPKDVSFMVVALEEAYEREWVGLTRDEEAVIIEQWHMDEGKPAQLCSMIEAKLKELNT